MRNLQVLPVLVGLSLCTAGAALLYKWYKTKSAECDEVDAAMQSGLRKKSKPSQANKKITKVESTIPNDKVPLVIGRSGANVKAIEEKTQTKITFREKDDAHQVCEISGQYENVMKAADLVKEETSRSTNITDEMIVPNTAYAKIIGKCGKTLQEICRRSLTQVHIDAGISGDKSMRRVKISGSRLNVQMAKRLIQEKIRQDEEEREAESKREPRYSPKGPSASVSTDSLEKDSLSTPRPLETELKNETLNVPGNSNGQLEVYVSAVASPARFWIQMIGPQTTKLDQLVEEMTEYYSQEENRALHRIENASLEKIVAAMFKYDSKWYRAVVVGILPNQYDPRNVVLDLYFIDYGDSAYVQPNEVFELRTDFLELRVQATECFLANVQPAYPTGEHQWNSEALSRFEDLTHVAKWKKLTAKIVTTKERSKDGDLNKREGSPVPGIELYDIIDGREVSIASKLILEGFAVPANHSDPPTPLSRYSSSDSILRLDSGSLNGSVAEKAMMFELTANLHRNSNSSPKSKFAKNGSLSPSPRKKFNNNENHKENNGNIHSVSTSNQTKQANGNSAGHNQNLLTSDSLGNRSWSEIMEAESDNFA